MGIGHLFKEHKAVLCFGQPTVVNPAVPLTLRAVPAAVPVGRVEVLCARLSPPFR